MTSIPTENTFDNSLSLLSDGFEFIQKRCREFNSDIFQTRLMGEKVVCLSGEEAAKVFYDGERFMRTGAVPKLVQKTLMGENGVQTLDDEEHHHRKAMFMSLMTPDAIHKLQEHMANHWLNYLKKWEQADQVVLFGDVQQILCRAACNWTGVPLQEDEVDKRADDFGAMIDAFGTLGPRHWRGRNARSRTESWIEEIINQVRNKELQAEPGSPLDVVAWHKELNGELMDIKIAAVELINLIRPIVAISTYIIFGAMALHQKPQLRQKMQQEDEKYLEWFVQEVRRFYPFGPFLGARVRNDFKWRDYEFKKGLLVLLDIYGTNHDERSWVKPDEFLPDRFRNWSGSPFNLIPQGGGDFHTGHRCAGEWITIELTKAGLTFLTKCMEYNVPEQDLSYSLSRMPTLPESKFIINNVEMTGHTGMGGEIGKGKCPFHN